jgi:hypothetical protein
MNLSRTANSPKRAALTGHRARSCSSFAKFIRVILTDQTNSTQKNPNGLGLNQVWILEDRGNSQFKICSLTNDLVWAVPPDQINQNAYPFLDYDSSSSNHLWRFDDLGGGTFKISCVASSGQVLDMPNGSHEEGKFVQQYAPAHGGPNQQWLVQAFSA